MRGPERPSRSVDSPQTGPHPRLLEHLARRRRRPFARPPAEHTRAAVREIWSVLDREGSGPVILDAGCGTGESSLQLAERHPDAWILGVDQSQHRLRTSGVERRADRVLVARAELADLWRAWCLDGRSFEKTYLLYPNPWPKPEHLFRRWHGHPVFREVLTSAAEVEARTNWRTYLEEMALAAHWLTGRSSPIERLEVSEALSPFERKYARSGQALYRWVLELPPREDWPKV